MRSNARLTEILDKYEEDAVAIEQWFRYAETITPEGVPELDGAQIEDLLDKGGEGEGSHAEVVRRVTYADGYVELLRMTGYYASYVGFDWEYGSIHLCVPKQISVTIYDKA